MENTSFYSFPSTTASGRERPRSMETIHKLRDRTGAISNTVSKLFRMKNFRRKSKEFKDPVVLSDEGIHTYSNRSTIYNKFYV